MVTNVLGDLKQEGAIATRGHQFILLSREKLAGAIEAV
jgi:CRP/FNR family transcriptional regulator